MSDASRMRRDALALAAGWRDDATRAMLDADIEMLSRAELIELVASLAGLAADLLVLTSDDRSGDLRAS
jgi:hypothetical protein